MEEVEVFRFHPTQPTVKKTMLLTDFKKMKKQKGYVYRAYEIGYNTSIILPNVYIESKMIIAYNNNGDYTILKSGLNTERKIINLKLY